MKHTKDGMAIYANIHALFTDQLTIKQADALDHERVMLLQVTSVCTFITVPMAKRVIRALQKFVEGR